MKNGKILERFMGRLGSIRPTNPHRLQVCGGTRGKVQQSKLTKAAAGLKAPRNRIGPRYPGLSVQLCNCDEQCATVDFQITSPSWIIGDSEMAV